MRKHEGKTLEELEFHKAVSSLHISVLKSCMAWMKIGYFPKFTAENWPSPEEIGQFQEQLIKSMLTRAIETLDMKVDNEAEKFMGPGWEDRIRELRSQPEEE